jgi:hypothetical protein
LHTGRGRICREASPETLHSALSMTALAISRTRSQAKRLQPWRSRDEK